MYSIKMNNYQYYHEYYAENVFKNYHVSINVIVLWFIQRFFVVENRFHVKTGQWVSNAH